MPFTAEQKAALEAKLHPSHVASRKQGGAQVSYIEGWHAEAEANRIFGFDGWDSQTLDLRVVAERERKIGQQQRDGWGVSYVARVRVTVRAGDTEVVREGVGAGHGIDADLGAAHESAAKEATTDAEKRALKTFGNPFGLALYDKSKANVGIDQPAPARPANGNCDGIDLKKHWTDWAGEQVEMFKQATRTDLAEWQEANRERCSACLKHAPKAHARMMELFDLRLDDICISEGPKPEPSIIAAG